MITIETSTMKVEHGEGPVHVPPPRPSRWARLRKWLGLCDHQYVPVDTFAIKDREEFTVGMIYVRECRRCGRLRRWRFMH